jgi:molecular chaperone GrpE
VTATPTDTPEPEAPDSSPAEDSAAEAGAVENGGPGENGVSGDSADQDNLDQGQASGKSEASTDADLEPEGPGSAEDQLDEAVDVLLKLQAERDAYLEQAQRATADHANAKKRWERERAQVVERAEERLASSLLVVLDACDSAVAHGAEDVAPIQTQLLNTLTAAGLGTITDSEVAFDPNLHSAVTRVEGEGTAEGGEVVAEVLRPGYTWRGNLLRPAMVSVRG